MNQITFPFNGCIVIESNMDKSSISEIMELKLISALSDNKITETNVVDIHIDVDNPIVVSIKDNHNG